MARLFDSLNDLLVNAPQGRSRGAEQATVVNNTPGARNPFARTSGSGAKTTEAYAIAYIGFTPRLCRTPR